jgi:hypothetical protein
MDPFELFDEMWSLEAEKDPSHGGMSKKRARRIFLQPWFENDPFVARRLEAVERSEGYGNLSAGGLRPW